MLQKEPKPFIQYGPSIIKSSLHGSKCGLLLFVNDDDELRTFRSSTDLYPYGTNFSDLPELINDLDDQDGKTAAS